MMPMFLTNPSIASFMNHLYEVKLGPKRHQILNFAVLAKKPHLLVIAVVRLRCAIGEIPSVKHDIIVDNPIKPMTDITE